MLGWSPVVFFQKNADGELFAWGGSGQRMTSLACVLGGGKTTSAGPALVLVKTSSTSLGACNENHL